MLEDKLKIRAAHALSKDKFCLAIHAEQLGDNFSIILQYDPSNPIAAWSRGERNSRITAMCGFGEGYAALSDNGDAYLIEGQSIKNETVYNTESKWQLDDIARIGSDLYVSGRRQQVYRRVGVNNWEQITSEAFAPGTDFSSIAFKSIGGSGSDNIYVCGMTQAKSIKKDPQLKEAIQAAKKNRDREEYVRLSALARKQESAASKPNEGRAYHWNGTEWDDISVEEYSPEVIYVENSDKVYIGVNQGDILVGNAEDGFDAVHVHDEMTNVYSIAKMNDKVICATSYDLFSFVETDEGMDADGQRLKPKLSKTHPTPSPLKIQTVGDVMFYFDYNFGVYIWDGEDEWTQIPIPEKLLKREM